MILRATLLAAAWLALTGEVSAGNVVFGLLLGALCLLPARVLGPEGGFGRLRPWRLPGFALFFVWELVVANLRVAATVLGSRRRLRPVIVAVPLDLTREGEIALLANLITLTPGTLSLKVAADRRTLYVHAMSAESPDALRREIKSGFERRIREVFA